MAKKVHPDGKVTYYYYKKKVGRHKKPGPKKKPKPKPKKPREKFMYKIIQFDFNKQMHYIGTCRTTEDAMEFKELLLEKNAQVAFPKRFVNCYRKNKNIFELKSEYVILKKNLEDDGTPKVTQLRNEYGKLVDNKTTSSKWYVYDKFPCLTEETFWVYGYNPRSDRKEFNWIFDNFITNKLDEVDMVIVYIYNNKVIFKYDEDFNFVICKNISDAIRMYNIIEERTKKNKKVFMTGSAYGDGERGKATIQMIAEKTGWSYSKIWDVTTRH